MDRFDEQHRAEENVVTLLSPRDGLPPVGATPIDFARAADLLRAGRGPIAIDTERASEFRFDDRAFLVQLRRQDTGTILLAPEADRAAFNAALAPVLGDADWIIHAAPSDLPALSALGLQPLRLFDTELAGRLCGFPRVNLGALVEEVLGIRLEKGHADENWSTWPLPSAWVTYAALDVELLLELAEALTELLDAQDKLSIAEQEFAHIAEARYQLAHPAWDEVKGIGQLKSPRQRQIARALWQAREQRARTHDVAPGRILSNRGLVELASLDSPTTGQISAVLRSTRPRRHPEARVPQDAQLRAAAIAAEIHRALAAPPQSWTGVRAPDYNQTPAPRGLWSRSYPEAHAALAQLRELIDATSNQINIPGENIVQPAALRDLIWHATVTGTLRTSADVRGRMAELGVRPWQQDLVLPLLSAVLF